AGIAGRFLPKARWQSGDAAACKAAYTGSIPVLASSSRSRASHARRRISAVRVLPYPSGPFLSTVQTRRAHMAWREPLKFVAVGLVSLCINFAVFRVLYAWLSATFSVTPGDGLQLT